MQRNLSRVCAHRSGAKSVRGHLQGQEHPQGKVLTELDSTPPMLFISQLLILILSFLLESIFRKLSKHFSQ